MSYLIINVNCMHIIVIYKIIVHYNFFCKLEKMFISYLLYKKYWTKLDLSLVNNSSYITVNLEV